MSSTRRSIRCPTTPLKDFEPVALLATSAPLLVAKQAMPANNLKELIAWLKANPDKATLGTVGAGSPPHVAGVALPEPDRHPLPLRALSRHRAGDAGPAGRADRSADRLADHVAAAGCAPARSRPMPCSPTDRYRIGARHSDHGRSGAAGISHDGLECAVDREGHAAATSSPKLNAAAVEALADPAGAKALRRISARTIRPREQQTPEALGALQRADIDEVVADGQGGEHQGRVGPSEAPITQTISTRLLRSERRRAKPRRDAVRELGSHPSRAALARTSG